MAQKRSGRQQVAARAKAELDGEARAPSRRAARSRVAQGRRASRRAKATSQPQRRLAQGRRQQGRQGHGAQAARRARRPSSDRQDRRARRARRRRRGQDRRRAARRAAQEPDRPAGDGDDLARADRGGARRGRRPGPRDGRATRSASPPGSSSAGSGRPATCSRTSRTCSTAAAAGSRAAPRARAARAVRARLPGAGAGRPRAPRRRRRAELPDHRLRRPDRGPDPGPPRQPHAGRAAQGARPRAPQREPQDRAAARSSRSSARLAVASLGAPVTEADHAPPPAHGRRARADDRPARPRRRRRRAARRLRRVRARRRAGRPRAGARDQVQALVRRGATRSSCSSRRPTAIEPVAPHPGAPWQVLPYERQLSEKEDQVRDALERIGRFESPPVEPIVPAVEPLRYRNKLEYSFGEDDAGRAGARLPPPGPLRPDRRRERRTSSPPSASTSCARRSRPGAARRACRPGTGATSTGLLRNLVVREGRRTGQLQARLVTSPGRASSVAELAAATPADSFLWTRAAGRRRDHPRRRDRGGQGQARTSRRSCPACASASRPTPSSRPTPRWPSASTGRAVELAGLSGRERVLDLFCGIGTIALALALDAGEVWGVEIVEEAVADAIENARLNGVDNAQLLRRRRARWRCGRCSSSRASPTWWWSTRRAPACRRRSCGACSRRRRSGSSTSRATRPRWRPNARQMVDAGYELQDRPAGRHVPADAAHRVRRAAGARLARRSASSSSATSSFACTVHRNGAARSRAPPGSRASVSVAPHSAQRRSITGSTPSCSSSSTSPRSRRRG